MCDEKSQIIDGDQIIAMIASRWKRKKILKGGVIGTLMSNYGLEKFFLSEKIHFKRSKVGDRYVKEMMKKNNFPNNFSLKGMRIVLDCANGAGYKSAPKILSDLGAKVFSIGIKPDGLNINYNCGSTFPKVLKR